MKIANSITSNQNEMTRDSIKTRLESLLAIIEDALSLEASSDIFLTLRLQVATDIQSFDDIVRHQPCSIPAIHATVITSMGKPG